MRAVQLATSLANSRASQEAPPSSAGGWLSIDLQRLSSDVVVIGLEVVVLALACGILYAASIALLSRLVGSRKDSVGWRATARLTARKITLVGFLLLLAGVVAYDAWLMARGADLRTHTTGLIRSFDAEWRLAIAMALGKLALSAIALSVAVRFFRRLMRTAEGAVNRRGLVGPDQGTVAALFAGLDHAVVNVAWLLLAVLACRWLGFPPRVGDWLLLIVRIYLVIAIGLVVIRSTEVALESLAQLSERTARDRGWMHYYDRVRPLLPTLGACLEYALWIGMVSLLLLQIEATRNIAAWGPRLIAGIAIFFAGRVVIEVGFIEIGRRMLPEEGLDETDRRRRETMVPLVRSAFTYAVYFGIAVLILSTLGFNPMPFLAGAGILGLVIGFGAQSLISDVVSGFFILLENTYLVGDTIDVAGASGVVEDIDFRTTKIRDRDGRVYIIRNGDMKPVINYSKGYTLAVVPVDVAYDADLRAVFATLRGAGERLRTESADVLADTTIDGITAFGRDSMTVRTSTRVRPGRHDVVAAKMRLLLKEAFDRQAAGTPRKTLIPHTREALEPQPAAGRQS
jgi:moderate conductance mechanosensitive channel